MIKRNAPNKEIFFTNIFYISVSSVPMHHVTRLPRMRSLSMEEYDKPLRQRSISGGGQESPLSGSPSNSDPPIPQSVTN